MTREQSPGLLTTVEAAKLYGVSVQFFHSHKELPRLRVGRRLRWDADQLRRHFERQATRTPR